MVSDESVSNELDCKIIVDGVDSVTELAVWIAEAIGGQAATDSIEAPGLEIIVDENDDANVRDKSNVEEGFLFFSHIVEIYFAPSWGREHRVHEVSRVLEYLWARDVPAVAACSYEDELPRSGGIGAPFHRTRLRICSSMEGRQAGDMSVSQ